MFILKHCSFLAVVIAVAPLLHAADNPLEDAPASLPLRTAVRSRFQLPPFPKPGVVLHLSPFGKDAGTGSDTKPFATLERCRDEIRALKSKGALPDGGVLVLIHGGEYPLKGTFQLTGTDSGTANAPIRYAATPGEKPLFQGGKRLTGWRRLTGKDDYPLLPAESWEMVWVADLRASGIGEVLPLKLGGFGSGNGFVTHPAHELYFNGRAMQLARGPNEGFLRIKDVEVDDGTKGYDRRGSKTGRFFYGSDLPGKWVNEPDLLLYGYWFWDWADSYERVAAIGRNRRLITLAEPWHKYGFRAGAPFYAVNALSELDTPGEWFIDRSQKTLLLYPPRDPARSTAELSVAVAPLLEMKDVSHVIFEGITWDMGCADGIRINGGDHCVLAGCTVKRFAGNGIEIQGGHDHILLSCDISSMGRGGVVMSGGDRKTLQPGGHLIENCDIHDLSRIDHTYTPAILVTGVGNRIAHNRLHGVPSSAMRVAGNDMTVEYNEVFNVVTESDDQGGVDMWGDPSFRGNVFRFNYWHDIGNRSGRGNPPTCGQAGIRLDDAICGTLIAGNVFERCAAARFGAIQIHGGKDNVVDNNLFIDCIACISFSPWARERWLDFVGNWEKQAKIDMELHRQRYPAMTTLLENPNTNRVSRNLTLRCSTFMRNAPTTVDAGGKSIASGGAEGAGALDPGFSMRTSPVVFNAPGLDPIPLGEIGSYADEWRKENTR